MGSKRGAQRELCLSWLRHRRPRLLAWAVSAKVGNLSEAARIMPWGKGRTETRSLLPERIDGFPWALASGPAYARGARWLPQAGCEHVAVHQHP